MIQRVARGVLLAVICMAGLAAALIPALYYRAQAASYERKWRQLAAIYRAGQASSANRGPAREEAVEWEEEVPAEILPPVTVQVSVEEPKPAQSETNALRRSPEERGGAPRREGEWLTGFRTNDPGRYEAMQRRREESKAQAERAFSGATNYFLFRDTRNMSEADREDFLQMLALMQETRSVVQQMQAGLPTEDRRQAMATVRSNLVALAPLLDNERDQEMFDLALSMGHSETEAERMVAYVKQITSNTSLRVIFPDISRRGRLPGIRD